MQKIFCLLSWCFLCVSLAHAQPGIEMGRRERIFSHRLNESREILIYEPRGSMDSIFSRPHYPVVYVLDGDDHFESVVAMTKHLAAENGGSKFPPMIIVGIPNTNRTRDLTPSHVEHAPMLDSVSSSFSGGGENFMAFIEKELIPHIDSVCATAPYRFLIGHSFGGLTVINTLINHRALFNAYLAIDPSMSWDDQRLLKQAVDVMSRADYSGKSLFLAVANTMDPGMDTSMVRKDGSTKTLHIRSILAFADVVRKNKQDGLVFDWKYYPNYSHGTVPLVAEFDAFLSLFSFYELKLSFDQFMNPGVAADSIVKAHYQYLSRQMGYKVLPSEPFINFWGYQLLGAKQFEKSYRFFQMNIENYPGSFNGYDSMGDWYQARGDRANAMLLFEKSLALKETADTRRKLEGMRNSQ